MHSCVAGVLLFHQNMISIKGGRVADTWNNYHSSILQWTRFIGKIQYKRCCIRPLWNNKRN